MKILHVIRSVNPVGGGPIEAVKQLGLVNGRLGHRIEVASLDAPDAQFLKTFPMPVHPLGPSWLNYGYSNRLFPWLRENVTKYDIVIVNGLWQYNSFGVWRVLHNSDIPYVAYSHGMLDPWFNETYPLKHLKKALYWPWAEYRVLRDASAVLFTSEEERILARQSFRPYRCNEIVVRYGAAGPTGDPQTELNTFYERFPHLRGRRLAIFLGRLHEKKGCDLLIQAFAAVLASDPDWHLIICGPDQVGWQAKLSVMAEQFKISDRISWIGMVSGNVKWGALHASEVFVLPSHQENFGIVVAEALACGVPVLISNKVNIWREVQNAGAGLVGADDLEGACAVLKTWTEMSSQQKFEMRTRARECFLQNFEIHEAARSLINTLSNITATARGAVRSNV
jgi:glycosyltransferase involved in cell wall biosynthesis